MKNNFWKDKNIFVTGATGFLGSWLLESLAEQKANRLVGLVRDWVPESNTFVLGLKKRVNFVFGSLEDYHLLERTLNEYEIDIIFHLGAQTIVKIANTNPLSTFESNIKGTWNVLEAVRRTPSVKAVIVASSDKAYGYQEKLPYSEADSLKGIHPYDVSKSCADLISQAYHKTYSIPVCITRCGNFFGGGDLNFNRLIPGTIKSILNNERPIIRSDGKFIRDYIYIKDAVCAYLLLAQRMMKKDIHGEAFNFSNEIRMSALQIVKLILELMGRDDLTPKILNEVKYEIKEQYLSSKKSRKALGWQSQYTLEQGLRETIGWYKKFLAK